MKNCEIAVQTLLGKIVKDRNGKPVGRLEEIHTQAHGNEVVVKEYVLGPSGLFARLALTGLRLRLIPFLHPRKYFSPQKISWDKMDISDPKHPRLL
jgi:hypothetical protein